MHTYISKHSIPARSTPMVCVPGYGAGIGFFWKNLQGLSSQSDLYAVDPLGTGLSSRPRFSAKSTGEAEDFFVNALSEWRKAVGVDKMVLVGHSMGGYLATVYALKHPEHVKHLVLVSPAGIVSCCPPGALEAVHPMHLAACVWQLLVRQAPMAHDYLGVVLATACHARGLGAQGCEVALVRLWPAVAGCQGNMELRAHAWHRHPHPGPLGSKPGAPIH
mmetsp:Transcript_13501/g.38376  ORF Transcript_13501/g.38376 Transcript_13501/m.38376 type:complete len:219 (+) Transcript_13501:711-1367(+)